MPEQHTDCLLWIDGVAVDSEKRERFTTRNPATGSALAEVALAGADDAAGL